MIWGCDADLTKSRVHYLGYSLRNKTYNIIIGSGVVTDFVCLPDYDVSFRLDSLEDKVSNAEHLRRHFCPEESCLIAAALKDYAEN